MKSAILVVFFSIVFISCHDSEIIPSQVKVLFTVDKSSEAPPFIINPTGIDQLTITFLHNQERELKSLTLMKGDVKITTVDFGKAPYGNPVYTAAIKHTFDNNESYDFLLETHSFRDTVFTYRLNGYKHYFISTFQYDKIAEWTQINEYDIDPNRKFLFVQDYFNNQSVLKRISLEDFSIEIFPNSFLNNSIRAISESEIISSSNYYNGRYLQGDSAALLKYNIISGNTQFLDWTSDDYIRLSRVVDNHLMYSNPIFTSKTSTLIDLTDYDKTIFSNSEINPLTIRNESFDNLYSGDFILDFNANTFINNVIIPENAFIAYIDNNSQTSFAIETVMGKSNLSYKSRLLVFRGSDLIYQSEYEDSNSIDLGKLIQFENNKLIFFKKYGFSNNFRISGYYSLDLLTGITTLIHCDNYDSIKRDFTLMDNIILSIRANGLYKITVD